MSNSTGVKSGKHDWLKYGEIKFPLPNSCLFAAYRSFNLSIGAVKARPTVTSMWVPGTVAARGGHIVKSVGQMAASREFDEPSTGTEPEEIWLRPPSASGKVGCNMGLASPKETPCLKGAAALFDIANEAAKVNTVTQM
ncbi:hypothetical protein CSAL01_06631 [Colletotrichum salicis]|uniref:Uncharacterized protein n=1 Tax=Colletotrichum salicis TaxID=1209931 RepID=A0A135UGN1_9PEZI|nr:hypothetical protein CSAL01_06631 [Colletotrichum salicis]